MKGAKGKINVSMAEEFMADHYDSFEKKTDANERALCGRVDTSARGIEVWEWPPYFPGGAVQGKAMDGTMAKAIELARPRWPPVRRGLSRCAFS